MPRKAASDAALFSFGQTEGCLLKICGLQKLTLLDYPEKVACTVFTGGCNLRCPFCHNASLVVGEQYPDEIPMSELFAYLEKRRNVLDGVCVTGGEPLLQPGLDDFLGRLRELGYAVKLDTNGTFPDRLRSLVQAGLVDYVAMDVKNSPERYAETTGTAGLDFSSVRKSMDFLLSGFVDYEFRTTVVKGLHDADSLLGAARSIRGAKRYFLQKFVDSGELIQDGFSAFSDVEMLKFRDLVAPFVQSAALRGVQNN
ncbi:MAG TPA: anaerobic ribonucleoside-triphosphate reductase activating protein [Oscillospiraceae bacterium]|nr:anaerobic ribonucleoside-triphosphate reductase activating protein [Oscillospiraceae bacterium]